MGIFFSSEEWKKDFLQIFFFDALSRIAYKEPPPFGTDLGGDVDVALRRFNTTAGVIVGDDDSRSTVGQRIREDFARMNRAPVYQANRNDADVQDFIRAIDAGA